MGEGLHLHSVGLYVTHELLCKLKRTLYKAQAGLLLFSMTINTYGTIDSIFVEIQPDSTNIKNDPLISANIFASV